VKLKNLFQRLFPTPADFKLYLQWRELRHKEAVLQKKIAQEQKAEAERKLVITGDIEDEDWDPMAEAIWEEVTKDE